ncbi:proteasome inhibitor PI31 subunit [Cloeon dipterum]|uniref:proteasome inhibitor PI31 subunit n=1 Tax=Cloeon dipterum TaxID=197152 RepID=UPI00321FC2DF
MEKIVKKLDPDVQPMSKMVSLGSCWELLYHIEKGNVKSEQDVIILMVHLILIKNDFQCIQEEDAQYVATQTSEILPTGWNSDSKDYKILYTCSSTKYHLSAHMIEDVLSINLLNLKSQKTHSIVVPISLVKKLEGPLATMIPSEKDLFNQIWSEMVKPAKSEGQRDVESQTAPIPSSSSRFVPVGTDPIIFPRGIPSPNLVDPFRVGERDLNPLAPMGPGGGMLMEPLRRGLIMPDRNFPGLPRGAVPPGARFDPIMPGMPGRRAGPDPDHLPMPGGNNFDNMFM